MPSSDRIAAITGASSGLGATYARQLAARGWNLLLAARRAGRLEELKRELESAHGVGVECLPVDLADPTQSEAFGERLRAEQRLEMLVNNAGFGTLGAFHQTDYSRQVEMVRLHVLATMLLTRAALSGMIPRDRGAIINISSVAAFARSPGNVSYCATKGWMNDFTEGLRLELDLIHSKVVLQALCPGFTYTEFHDVLGVDRGKVPRRLWMPAEFVVEESLSALDRRKLIVIPGWKYAAFVALWTRLPLALRMWLQRKSPHKRT